MDDLQIQHKGTDEIWELFADLTSSCHRDCVPENHWKRDNSNRCIDSANHSSTVVQYATGSHELKYLKRLKLANLVTQDGAFEMSLLVCTDHY